MLHIVSVISRICVGSGPKIRIRADIIIKLPSYAYDTTYTTYDT